MCQWSIYVGEKHAVAPKPVVDETKRWDTQPPAPILRNAVLRLLLFLARVSSDRWTLRGGMKPRRFRAAPAVELSRCKGVGSSAGPVSGSNVESTPGDERSS